MSENHVVSTGTPSASPWDAPWPKNELEHLSSCPVCHGLELKFSIEI